MACDTGGKNPLPLLITTDGPSFGDLPPATASMSPSPFKSANIYRSSARSVVTILDWTPFEPQSLIMLCEPAGPDSTRKELDGAIAIDIKKPVVVKEYVFDCGRRSDGAPQIHPKLPRSKVFRFSSEVGREDVGPTIS